MTTITASTIPPAVGDQVSTVQLEAVVSDDSTARVDDKTLESMVELMLRTRGVLWLRDICDPGLWAPADDQAAAGHDQGAERVRR